MKKNTKNRTVAGSDAGSLCESLIDATEMNRPMMSVFILCPLHHAVNRWAMKEKEKSLNLLRCCFLQVSVTQRAVVCVRSYLPLQRGARTMKLLCLCFGKTRGSSLQKREGDWWNQTWMKTSCFLGNEQTLLSLCLHLQGEETPLIGKEPAFNVSKMDYGNNRETNRQYVIWKKKLEWV